VSARLIFCFRRSRQRGSQLTQGWLLKVPQSLCSVNLRHREARAQAEEARVEVRPCAASPPEPKSQKWARVVGITLRRVSLVLTRSGNSED
jgi:hypothetical protein